MDDCHNLPLLNKNFAHKLPDKMNTEWHLLNYSQCSCEVFAMINHGILFKCLDKSPLLPFSIQIAFFCAFSVIALLSLMANSIVVWIILWHPIMHHRATNRHVLNLTISDLCLTLFNTVPFGIANVLERWPFPAWSCSIQQMIGVIPFCVSVFTMVLISLDRYYAILYPLHNRPWGDPESRRFTLIGLAVVWILGFLCALPEFFIIRPLENVVMVRMENGQSKVFGIATFCEPIPEENAPYQIYNWMMLIIQFLLPISILAYAYGHIAIELYSPKCIPPANSVRDSILAAKRRTAKLFALLVFSFMALWFPYELMFMVPKVWLVNIWPIGFKIILNLAFLLAMSSTVVSPIIYFNMSERFRVGFCYALRWVPLWRGAGIGAAEYREVFGLNGCPQPSPSRALFMPNDGDDLHHNFGMQKRRSTCDTTIRNV